MPPDVQLGVTEATKTDKHGLVRWFKVWYFADVSRSLSVFNGVYVLCFGIVVFYQRSDVLVHELGYPPVDDAASRTEHAGTVGTSSQKSSSHLAPIGPVRLFEDDVSGGRSLVGLMSIQLPFEAGYATRIYGPVFCVPTPTPPWYGAATTTPPHRGEGWVYNYH